MNLSLYMFGAVYISKGKLALVVGSMPTKPYKNIVILIFVFHIVPRCIDTQYFGDISPKYLDILITDHHKV